MSWKKSALISVVFGAVVGYGYFDMVTKYEEKISQMENEIAQKQEFAEFQLKIFRSVTDMIVKAEEARTNYISLSLESGRVVNGQYLEEDDKTIAKYEENMAEWENLRSKYFFTGETEYMKKAMIWYRGMGQVLQKNYVELGSENHFPMSIQYGARNLANTLEVREK